MQTKVRGFLLLSLVFTGVVAGSAFFLGHYLYFYTHEALINSSAQKTVETKTYIINIEKGDGPTGVVAKLQALDIPVNPQRFYWSGRLHGIWPKLKAGEYELKPPITVAQIFKQITSGISIGYPITIREGENLFEISKTIANFPFLNPKEFTRLVHSPAVIKELLPDLSDSTRRSMKNLEGYLFPNTYVLSKKTTELDLIKILVRESNKNWGIAQESRARAMGWDRHQVVTLASMVEKETGAAEERPLIASVFFNRLRKKMRLQSDPTTIYGIWHRYQGNLRKSDLLEYTPYNTYAIPALPVGPISNPGKESIEAVLSPANSEYLFFVSRNDGTHVFTTKLSDHEKAVRDFQKNAKAREGKSWRDLQKRKPH